MINFNFTPFPILESDRLVLRDLTTNDIDSVFALRSNSKLMQFVPRPVMQLKDEALTFIHLLKTKETNKEAINWAITLKDSDIMIGNICLFMFNEMSSRGEIGYMILEEHSGKGLMTEAVQLVLQYGFQQMNLNAIEALIANGNDASIKVIEKSGFTKDGYLREFLFFNDRYIDMHLYSMLKKEFLLIK